MEKLKLKHRDAAKALDTLKEALDMPFSIIVRDAAIQRFEYTFEALWKFLKDYLKEQEGIVCNSPKSCFRDAFSVGLLTEEETVSFLEMADDRNMTSHTYKEEVSQLLYQKMRGYSGLMGKLLTQSEVKMQERRA